jgi:small subunit ribosomal protein S9
MNEDEKQNEETSEESQDSSPQDDRANPAGPPPAVEAEAPGGEGSDDPGDASADEPVADAGDTEDRAPEELAEDAATESDETREVVVEDAEGAVAEVEVEVEAEEPRAKEKKADVIPGADLEPIAVEEAERPLSAEEQARVEAEEEERARREAELVGEGGGEDEDRPAPREPAKLEGDARFLATGKRKSAIARVTLLPGSGEIVINRRPLEEFFPRPLHQTMARQPLATTGYEGSVDVRVRVHGGGISGQAGAVRHGIARALTEVDPELRSELKRRGFLTRDARVKERRKAGLKKARKRPQFSKR